MTITIPVLSPEQAAAWDARAEQQGMPLDLLMEAAGRAAAHVIAARCAIDAADGVLVLVGRGHNGGDGWVVARALHAVGIRVCVTGPGTVAGDGTVAPLTALVAERARRDGVREVPMDGPWPGVGLVVDALLGTGATGMPRAPIPQLLARVADLARPVVAIDGPTGLDLATGTAHEPPLCRMSITFGGVRRGHLLARDECGEVVVVEIGLPRDLPPGVPQLVTDAWAAERLAPFAAAAQKGVRGRVVVVGGAAGMSGAARLAARAAFAAGAGLVWTLTPKESAYDLAQAEPDVQARVLPLDGPLDDAARDLVAQADAVIMGPGLGRAPGRQALVLDLLAHARAAVLDADALVALASARAALHAHARRIPVICTPHPGEFRTLCPDLAGMRELDPWGAAAAAAELIGGTMLLKGVPSVIARTGTPVRTIAAGNPGLATGGSGDVLAGLIGALLAAGLPADVAAAVGAQALGRAADLAARRTGARTLRPMDVIAACRDLWREWDVLRRTPPAPRPPVLLELDRPITA